MAEKKLENDSKSNNSEVVFQRKTDRDPDITQAEPKDDHISLERQVESVTIMGKLLDEITEYSVKAKPREAIGLLGGSVLRPHEIVISKILFVSEGDEVSVSFSDEDFKAFEEILKDDSYCLGWWHSHPGYGLFLSETDINTHVYSFQLHNALSVALVVEPTLIGMDGRASFQFYQVIGEEEKSPFIYKEVASYLQH